MGMQRSPPETDGQAIQKGFLWPIRAIPMPVLSGYSVAGQFLGGGTCSSDSSHDCKVWDVLFCGKNLLARPGPSLQARRRARPGKLQSTFGDAILPTKFE